MNPLTGNPTTVTTASISQPDQPLSGEPFVSKMLWAESAVLTTWHSSTVVLIRVSLPIIQGTIYLFLLIAEIASAGSQDSAGPLERHFTVHSIAVSMQPCMPYYSHVLRHLRHISDTPVLLRERNPVHSPSARPRTLGGQ